MSTSSKQRSQSRRRDGAQTRERILAAAFQEFTAKGFAGARVEAVASSADVNVRALYQHFGSKEKLYEAVFGGSLVTKHNTVLTAIQSLIDDEEAAGDLLQVFHHTLADSLAFVRLVTWDALSVDMDSPDAGVVAADIRAEMYAKEIELVREAQRSGGLNPTLDPDLLLVALMGLAIFPSAVRPLTQMITGQAPESREFRDRYDAFLADLGRAILVPHGGHAVPEVDAESDRHRTLRLAARALSRAGLVTAYGHCSVRVDEEAFLATPAIPLGQIARERGILIPVRGDLPDGVAAELRLHQAIYRRRMDVNGIARTLSPAVRALSALGHTARALDGPGSYFAPGPPTWPHPQLVRDERAADEVAVALGDSPAIVLRGNGAVVVGDSLQRAVVLAQFLEEASSTDLAVRGSGAAPIELTTQEAATRAVWSGGILERMWSYLSGGDPEVEDV